MKSASSLRARDPLLQETGGCRELPLLFGKSKCPQSNHHQCTHTMAAGWLTPLGIRGQEDILDSQNATWQN